MELLYLWIEGYNNIQHQGFPFSSEFDIKFDVETKKISIAKSDKKKIYLFDEAFLNLTAIIGKNGAGKSSVFSFIKTVFSNSLTNPYRYILVIKSSDFNVLIIDTYSKDKENIFDKTTLEGGITVSIERTNNCILDSIDLIAHSNSFSVYEGDIYGSRFIDISFNSSLDQYSRLSNTQMLQNYDSLLMQKGGEKTNTEDEERTKNMYTNFFLPRRLFHQYDLLANVNFVAHYKNEGWDFIPSTLEISFNRFFFYNNRNYFGEVGLGSMLNNLSHFLFEKQNDGLKKEEIIILFKNKIIISLFLYCIVHDQYYHPGNEDLRLVIKTLSEEGDYESFIGFIKAFFEIPSNKGEYDYLRKIKEFVTTIDTHFNGFKEFQGQYSNSYLLNVSDEVRISLKELFDIWMDKDFIFYFNWIGLSAGESALLNIFSRISSIADFPDKKTIWLLIDEGDLYLHPEWQRTFFKDLHSFLPLFFKNKNIQLFLTSHSPFLISDLPKENIIFLDKVDGFCKVIPNDHFKETFGANIHELFTYPFFLNKGLIGEFAKNKINDSIKFLKFNPSLVESENNIKPSEEWTKEKVENFIKIIGEPLIAERLQKLFDEKYKTKEDIEKRIASLLEELKRTPK